MGIANALSQLANLLVRATAHHQAWLQCLPVAFTGQAIAVVPGFFGVTFACLPEPLIYTGETVDGHC